jgi:hypothetical protein
MSFYNSGIASLTETSSGYNVLTTSIYRPPLEITNFSNASSGYNIVVPAVNLDSISTYKVNGIDGTNTSLFIGPNSSVVQIGNQSTFIVGKITQIDSTVINIGMQTTTNLGNISSQRANLSLVNISTANIRVENVSKSNVLLLDARTTNISTANIEVANVSLANISVANISYLTCTNLSAISAKSCYALWYSNIQIPQNTYIGNISLTAIQNSSIMPLQYGLAPNSTTGLFTCAYSGMYMCSVIATPIDATLPAAVYLSKNQNCIGPIAYGNTSSSLSGSLTLYCNAADTLAFFNFGHTLKAGNNISTEQQVKDATLANRANSAQMCSIALL